MDPTMPRIIGQIRSTPSTEAARAKFEWRGVWRLVHRSVRGLVLPVLLAAGVAAPASADVTFVGKVKATTACGTAEISRSACDDFTLTLRDGAQPELFWCGAGSFGYSTAAGNPDARSFLVHYSAFEPAVGTQAGYLETLAGEVKQTSRALTLKGYVTIRGELDGETCVGFATVKAKAVP